MKKVSGSKMNVMMGLVAVLIASVGYLIFQQGKEGLENMDVDMDQLTKSVAAAATAAAKKKEEEKK
jgi:hypothetical protein